MKKDLVILGAGGFAREASLLVEEINTAGKGENAWNLRGFIDEDPTLWGGERRGYPILGGFEALLKLPASVMVIAVVGDPLIKESLVLKAAQGGKSFATLIHPGVEPAPDVRLGQGVLINKGTLLTANISIGDHVSINPGCGIGHDAVIEDYVTLMWRVNISGNCRIKRGSLIGSGATLLPQCSLGPRTVVGAGSVVTKNLPAQVTVAGVPARVIKGKDNSN